MAALLYFCYSPLSFFLSHFSRGDGAQSLMYARQGLFPLINKHYQLPLTPFKKKRPYYEALTGLKLTVFGLLYLLSAGIKDMQWQVLEVLDVKVSFIHLM